MRWVAPLVDWPMETGREVVEHHDALAGIDERMNHMASDIAGAAGNQDRHARGPLISPGVAGLGLGNIRWRRECTCSRPVVSLALRLIHRFSTLNVIARALKPSNLATGPAFLIFRCHCRMSSVGD